MQKLKEISIEVTNKCDQKCVHCSSLAGVPFKSELSFNEIKGLIIQAKKLGATILTLSGGDPLIRSDIEKIIFFARRNEFTIRLQTSGVFLKNKNIKSIDDSFLNFFSKNLGNRGKIIFSLLGLKKTHEKTTAIPGSFLVLKKSINKSIKQGICVEIHTTITKLNYCELKDIYKLINNWGVNSWHPLRLVIHGRAKLNTDLSLSVKEFKKVQQEFIEIGEKLGKTKFKLGHNIDKRYWSSTGYKAKPCIIGENKILIRANGDIAYCAALKNRDNKNIRNNSLTHYWNNNSDILNLRSFIKSDYKNIIGKCKNCEKLNECKGGCLAQRLLIFDNICQGPDPLCYLK